MTKLCFGDNNNNSDHDEDYSNVWPKLWSWSGQADWLAICTKLLKVKIYFIQIDQRGGSGSTILFRLKKDANQMLSTKGKDVRGEEKRGHLGLDRLCELQIGDYLNLVDYRKHAQSSFFANSYCAQFRQTNWFSCSCPKPTSIIAVYTCVFVFYVPQTNYFEGISHLIKKQVRLCRRSRWWWWWGRDLWTWT